MTFGSAHVRSSEHRQDSAAVSSRPCLPVTSACCTNAWADELTSSRNLLLQVKEKNLRVDFMCVHWYPGWDTSMTDSNSAAKELADYMIAVHEKYGRPIWLTEFAYIDYNHGGTR